MAPEAKSQPTHKVPFHLPLLGFNHMVAPINKTTHPKHSNVFGGGLSRALHQLPWDFDAQTKVAPSLCAVIRGFMEGKQISAEAIQSFLDQNKSMGRYDPSFKRLWVLIKSQGVAPQHATLGQVASAIIKLHHLSPGQAKNAYRGRLLLPGFSALRFQPLLNPSKKFWPTPPGPSLPNGS